MSIRYALALMPVCLTMACAPQTPQEQQAEQIREEADKRGDAIEAEARDRSAQMEAQAAALESQAGTSQSFDAQRLQVQADALKKQADLIEQQADAQAKAVRDAGQAQSSALLAN
ncbi:hypothetical protein [Sphingomonas qomolangmaensis]|uniref:DUF4398 domain-containing protein n=1 Tax=Sphingomonas qomolangmaensis TaxID=2918765 RepID=A0ABY5L9C4_9SPHN|nr:hypothetical protein [Sphingomonas qomolangmaensis]UUL82319.1 hypothetical protein NMP03_14215 [Sphingomonas qomolangmaensis]